VSGSYNNRTLNHFTIVLKTTAKISEDYLSISDFNPLHRL